jgi:hypothetical protein
MKKLAIYLTTPYTAVKKGVELKGVELFSVIQAARPRTPDTGLID